MSTWENKCPTVLVLMGLLWLKSCEDRSITRKRAVQVSWREATELEVPVSDLAEWYCIGIPVLVRWTAIAVFHAAAGGFTLL